jgi:hypothetical protein
LENKEYGRKLIFEKRSFRDKWWIKLAQDHIQQQGILWVWLLIISYSAETNMLLEMILG